MLIQYVGLANVRIVEGYRWDKANGYKSDVPEAKVAQELLTSPRAEFKIAEEEVLLKIVSQDMVEALMFSGIVSVDVLAAQKHEAEEVQEALAAGIGCTVKELRSWMRSATKLIH